MGRLIFVTPLLRTLRAALRRLERSRFAPAAAGADLAAVLPGRRYWREALEARLLEEDGAAVRLTAAGLEAAAPCATCGWTSCRGVHRDIKPGNAPAPVAERPSRRPSGDHPPAPPICADQQIELAAASLPIVLERLPASAGSTLRGVRRRQGDLYRRRAERALHGALRAWERTYFAEPAPGLDLSRFLRGKKRYWQGGGGAAGYIVGTKITAAGIEAARAYTPGRTA